MSASEIPTPIYPGVDVDANRGPYINSLIITFTVLAIISTGFRAFSRWWTKIATGWDDYLLVVAALFSWVFSAMILVETERNFFGQHIGKSDFAHLESFLKIFYVGLEIYTIALTFSKLSLLALYLRIFRGARSVWPVWIAIAINVGWMISIIFVSIFICKPIRGFWDVTITSKCLPYNTIFISNEALTITLDVMILFMPVYYISSIQRSLSQKISISSTFLLGLLATIFSIIRLWKLIVSIRLETHGFDPTFDEVDPVLWGGVEINLWVVVSSIPTFKPLVGKVLGNKKSPKSTAAHTYGTGTAGKLWRSGRSMGNTIGSQDSREDVGVEDYSILIQGKYNNSVGDIETKDTKKPSYYELHKVPQSIRVDHEVIVSNHV